LNSPDDSVATSSISADAIAAIASWLPSSKNIFVSDARKTEARNRFMALTLPILLLSENIGMPKASFVVASWTAAINCTQPTWPLRWPAGSSDPVTINPAFFTWPVNCVLAISVNESFAPAPKTLIYVSALRLLRNSLTAYGPNFFGSKLPNFVMKSANEPSITGTNAGPLRAVPITPAGVPTGCCLFSARSISLSKNPGD